MCQQPQPAEARLPFQPAGELVAERDDLDGGREHELTRMEDERLAGGDLDHGREIVLLDRRVDVRVQVVVEDPEQAVEPHVDARRLDQGRLERIEL
ncbi:MAG: hypothetical protein AUI10_10355 [Actinobacteria bacterium 13_2_20CM_2_72_6]|nr:MAG: hypothetical protein AUI10_10355 [Actinobacteria bacterium 13_2_20CM_2_72_6]